MYVPTHYNSYYSGRFGNVGSVYARNAQVGKAAQGQGSVFALQTGNNIYNQSAFGSDALKYVQNIKQASSGLGSALKGLAAGSAFRQQAAVSSDRQVMTLKDSSSSSASGTTASSVQVTQVAAAQENLGQAKTADVSAGLYGRQQMAIEVGGKTTQISFQTGYSDTNADVQRKMADAINAKGLGVTASVVTDSKAGTSQLKLEAQKTGAQEGGFNISNVSGEAFSAMGIGNVTQQAQDAIYSLDGGATRTSATNQVNIGGGVTATLRQAGQADVTRGADTDLAIGKVEDMVKSYNSLYGAALDNTQDSRANNLFTQLVGNSRTYSSSLAKVGISFDQDGYMQIDKGKMASAAEDGSLQSFFTQNAGKSYGFTAQLGRIADSVQTNTSRYVSPSSFTQASGSGYGSLYSNSYTNSMSILTNSLFGGNSSGGTSGWMFDFML